jgi:hypothetical protein
MTWQILKRFYKEEIMCLCGCESNAGKPFVVSPLKVRDIFCDQCKHYQSSGIHKGDIFKDKCFYPKILNRSRYVPGTPIKKGWTDEWTCPGDCQILNKNNNCEFFEQQDWPDRG